MVVSIFSKVSFEYEVTHFRLQSAILNSKSVILKISKSVILEIYFE